jgi:hypothetical protein
MGRKEIRRDGAECIQLLQDNVQWSVLLNIVMDLLVQAINLFINWTNY